MSCGFAPIKLSGFDIDLDAILGAFGKPGFSVSLDIDFPSFDESMSFPKVKMPGFDIDLDAILGAFGKPGFSISLSLPNPKCPLE